MRAKQSAHRIRAQPQHFELDAALGDRFEPGIRHAIAHVDAQLAQGAAPLGDRQ